jgi:hypothetical protein
MRTMTEKISGRNGLYYKVNGVDKEFTEKI